MQVIPITDLITKIIFQEKKNGKTLSKDTTQTLREAYAAEDRKTAK